MYLRETIRGATSNKRQKRKMCQQKFCTKLYIIIYLLHKHLTDRTTYSIKQETTEEIINVRSLKAE